MNFTVGWAGLGLTIISVWVSGLFFDFTLPRLIEESYTISREAIFDNRVYFYQVDDITGAVNGVSIESDDYLSTALDNVVSPAFSTSNNTESGTVEMESGLLAPLMIVDGDLEQAQNGNANVFTAYSGANTDNGSFDRIQLLDTNTFAFEDLPNGSDGDFDDLIISFDSFA